MGRLFTLLQCAALAIGAMQVAHAGVPQHLAAAATALRQGDSATALHRLLPLAKGGDAEARFMLVSVLQSSDLQQSRYWLLAAADQRHPSACHMLGLMYLHGNGVAQDPRLAMQWLAIAAEGGIRVAQLQLGQLYRTGPNAIQDDRQAAKWFGMAAQAGEAEAQYQMAQMYRYGYGVKADGNAMQQWLQRAAQQGHAQAIQARANGEK